MTDPLIIHITAQEMTSRFYTVLLAHGFEPGRAMQCAEIFTSNSVDGVYSHGVNRFPRFIEFVQKKRIHVHAENSLVKSLGSIEQWDGNLGPGPLNAVHATDRAIQLAMENGLGCVALSNTNHWMRGGYYGWHAAKKGFVLIAWTNTIPNMPAWKALDKRLGNNPLVMALPFHEEAIVLDMAMSQYSMGLLEISALKNQALPVPGGFDVHGQLTKDATAIIESGRALPVGYWKGAGMALLLDLLATILSGGLSTCELSKQVDEYAVSQIFICFDVGKLGNESSISRMVNNIINDYHRSVPESDQEKIVYPGENVLKVREQNLKSGIPVLRSVWNSVLHL